MSNAVVAVSRDASEGRLGAHGMLAPVASLNQPQVGAVEPPVASQAAPVLPPVWMMTCAPAHTPSGTQDVGFRMVQYAVKTTLHLASNLRDRALNCSADDGHWLQWQASYSATIMQRSNLLGNKSRSDGRTAGAPHRACN